MPIYKRCSRCNKRILEGTKCDCYKERHKEYKKYRTDVKEQIFYSSDGWEIIKEKVKDKFKKIDIYSYYIYGVIEYGQTVHHIESIKENWERRLDISNLIYLTESNHQKIHKLMRNDLKGTQKILYGLIKRFESEVIG